jgi:putative SOS response-associated peptidase YedK
VCNLYSLTKSQAAIVALVRAMRDRTGNLPPMSRIFPDYPAPIVRNAPDDRNCGYLLPSPLFPPIA